jgi:Ran GTPase-activating protein 1
MAATSAKVFSLQGKSLKLDSRSDIEPHLKDVDPTVVEEIHLGGNTIGVEAARALAEVLEKTTVLKVCGEICLSSVLRDVGLIYARTGRGLC